MSIELVAVHPIVLLSVVDHYNRVCQRNRNRRVIGVILGESSKGTLDVTNCYAIPFEEDPKDPNVWFLDHTYHETMFSMFKKVNAKEKMLGKIIKLYMHILQDGTQPNKNKMTQKSIRYLKTTARIRYWSSLTQRRKTFWPCLPKLLQKSKLSHPMGT